VLNKTGHKNRWPVPRLPQAGSLLRVGRTIGVCRPSARLGYASSLESSRIEILKQLLEQSPTSTFARYGLAMEYVKAGQLEIAVAEFEAVAEADPGYSAAYYHGGQAMEKLGRLDDARELYRRGIEQTRDPHASAELQAALDILGE
jgi:tetratricopeptide (TPR) repeat protein